MTRPAISGVSPFFIVADVPAALAFYRDLLGLVPINLLRIDNVNLYVFERPPVGQSRPAWFPPEVGDSFPSDGGDRH